MAPFLGIELEEVMATSRNKEELLWAWQGWWDAMGRQIRTTFEHYVELSNKVAQLNGEQTGRHGAQSDGKEGAKLSFSRMKAAIGPWRQDL